MKKLAYPQGRFSDDGREFIITTPRTPRPWINVISNGDYGVVMSQTGGGYSWRAHAQLSRVTRWEQDMIRDDWGKHLYLRDESGRVWSAGWKPVCAEPDRYQCRHGVGYTCIESVNHGIESSLLVFVPADEPLEIWKLVLRNGSDRPRTIDVMSYFEWALGAAPDWHREFHRCFIETAYDARARCLFATKRLWEAPAERGHWNTEWPYVAFHSASTPVISRDTDKESFLGMYRGPANPAALEHPRLAGRAGNALDHCGALHTRVALEPGAEATVVFTLGAADTRAEARALAVKYRRVAEVDLAFAVMARRWDALLATQTVATPDAAMDVMLNTWLKYQALSGRLWGRTAYYQTGGAYGFRDQLQDSQAALAIDPAITAKQILLHARHQFADGTAYHWWHPLTEVGLRSAISDNRLWLPFVVHAYLRETADFALLDTIAPFVDDAAGASLYEHCRRAIEASLARFSRRGLPLIGAGDWNDGLSAVGLDGRGESVWLGHFLHGILRDFSDVARRAGDAGSARRWHAKARALRTKLNTLGWDGGWYWRATKDDGEKLGSRENAEGGIYLNAQTWAVIAGVADLDRAREVMDAVDARLMDRIGPLLLHPAYATPDPFIGYLTRYAPGSRENGGVYTHAATWAIVANAMLGRGDRAYEVFTRINPAVRAKGREYFAEPYATAGNIEGPESPIHGRGGWTWYTGSAAWLFRAASEWILGVRPSFDGLVVDPCIPRDWKEFRVTRVFRGATYRIHVLNPAHVERGVRRVEVDGKEMHNTREKRDLMLPLFPSGTKHEVRVELGRLSE